MLKCQTKYLVCILLCSYVLTYAADKPKPFSETEKKEFLDKIYAQKMSLGIGGLMADYVKNYGTDKIAIIEQDILKLSNNDKIYLRKISEKIDLQPLTNLIELDFTTTAKKKAKEITMNKNIPLV